MPADDEARSPRAGHAAHRWEHHDELLPVDPDLAPDDPGEPSRAHRPVPHVRRSRRPEVVAAIAGGGFLGTMARYGLSRLWPATTAGFPWATFLVNMSGAFFLGLSLTLLLERFRGSRHLRPFLCVGVIGSWTTMSGFAVDTDLLVKNGHLATAAAYVVATVVSGLVLTWAGMALARAFAVEVTQ